MTVSELTGPLAWAGAVHLAMWSAGSSVRARILRAGEAGGSPIERAFQSAMVGFALLSILAFALGAVHALRPGVVAGVVLVLAAMGAARLVRARPPFPRLGAADIPLVGAVAFVLVQLPRALVPILEHDENVYHLLLPRLYLEAGALKALPWSLGANMPHLVDLSYVFPMSWGGETAAKAFVFGFIFWTLAGLAPLGSRMLGPMGPGVLAVLYLSGRVIQWHFGLAYVEPVIGALFLCALQSLRSYWEDGERGGLGILAIALGAAAASKYTVWPVAAVVLVVVALARPREGRIGLRGFTVCALVTAALVAPWMIKNAIITGNPLYPSLNGIFHSRFWSVTQDVQFQHEMGYGRGADREIGHYLRLPLQLVTDPYTGILGTAPFSATFMALLLAAMAFPWRRTEFATVPRVLSIAAFGSWCLGSKQGRYLVAFIPVMVVATAIPLVPLRKFRGALGALTIAAAAIAFVQIRLQPFPVVPLSDAFTQSKAELLSRNLCWDLAGFLNRTVPPDGRVFSFWENRLYFLERPFVADSAYGAPTSLARLRESGDPETFAALLRAEGVTHVIVNPYFYRTYMANGFLYSLIDETYYPPERLKADDELLERFLDTQLTPIPWEGDWVVARLRGAP